MLSLADAVVGIGFGDAGRSSSLADSAEPGVSSDAKAGLVGEVTTTSFALCSDSLRSAEGGSVSSGFASVVGFGGLGSEGVASVGVSGSVSALPEVVSGEDSVAAVGVDSASAN